MNMEMREDAIKKNRTKKETDKTENRQIEKFIEKVKKMKDV